MVFRYRPAEPGAATATVSVTPGDDDDLEDEGGDDDDDHDGGESVYDH